MLALTSLVKSSFNNYYLRKIKVMNKTPIIDQDK